MPRNKRVVFAYLAYKVYKYTGYILCMCYTYTHTKHCCNIFCSILFRVLWLIGTLLCSECQKCELLCLKQAIKLLNSLYSSTCQHLVYDGLLSSAYGSLRQWSQFNPCQNLQPPNPQPSSTLISSAVFNSQMERIAIGYNWVMLIRWLVLLLLLDRPCGVVCGLYNILSRLYSSLSRILTCIYVCVKYYIYLRTVLYIYTVINLICTAVISTLPATLPPTHIKNALPVWWPSNIDRF